MTGPEGPRADVGRLLRWYPAEWRRRYGDELAALIEDELDGRRPPLRLRLGLLRAGLGERARDGGFTGDSRPAADRVRAGGLVVLLAWAMAVVGGCAYAKTSERSDPGGPSSWSAAARAAHATVVAGAVVGAAIVVAAVVLALPAVPTFTRAGGWTSVRTGLVRAGVAAVVAGLGLVGLAGWARHLDPVARNGGDPAYTVAFLAWAVVVASTVVLWTLAGASVARRLDIGPRVLRVEAGLAVTLAVVIGVVAVAVGVWWVSVAVAFPTFLVGAPVGSHVVPVTAPLVVLATLLVAAVAGSAYGTVRIVRSWRLVAAG